MAPTTTTSTAPSSTTTTKSTTNEVDESTSTNNPTHHAKLTTKLPDGVDDDNLTVKIAIPLSVLVTVLAVCFARWYVKKRKFNLSCTFLFVRFLHLYLYYIVLP